MTDPIYKECRLNECVTVLLNQFVNITVNISSGLAMTSLELNHNFYISV